MVYKKKKSVLASKEKKKKKKIVLYKSDVLIWCMTYIFKFIIFFLSTRHIRFMIDINGNYWFNFFYVWKNVHNFMDISKGVEFLF